MTLTFRKRRNAVKLPYYQIEEIKEPGNTPAITAYLKERGVWQTAPGRAQRSNTSSKTKRKPANNSLPPTTKTKTAAGRYTAKSFTPASA
ncbi:MAG: hypothetical protein M3O71_20915 [Bacteroidota bacterium]|nr:hypothetical protein [Bacteroidota bacterium]